MRTQPTEALIRDLAARVGPGKPLGHPLARFGGWMAAAAGWIVAGVVATGVRADVAAAWGAPGFATRLLLPLAAGLAATLTAFLASVPGRAARWRTWIPAAAVAAWMGLVLAEALAARGGHAGAAIKCVRNLAVFSVPPGALLYLMLRRAAPLEGGTVGMLAALGSSALAQVGTQFVCRNDGARHVLIWHGGFVLLFGIVGIWLGRAAFRQSVFPPERMNRFAGGENSCDRV